MRLFNEENPKFQCFNCGAILESNKWNEKNKRSIRKQSSYVT